MSAVSPARRESGGRRRDFPKGGGRGLAREREQTRRARHEHPQAAADSFEQNAAMPRLLQRIVSVVDLTFTESPPAMISNSPGSTTYFMSAFQNANASRSSSNSTV